MRSSLMRSPSLDALAVPRFARLMRPPPLRRYPAPPGWPQTPGVSRPGPRAAR